MTTWIVNHNHRGLTDAEARARLKQFGPDAVAEQKSHPLKDFIKRFWACSENPLAARSDPLHELAGPSV